MIAVLIGCSKPTPTLTEGQRLEDQARTTLELIAASLSEAKSIDVYSLNSHRIDGQLPQPQGTKYLEHFQVLETRTLERSQQHELSAALQKDLLDSWNKHGIAECFDPHNGVRIQTSDRVIFLVICFRCHQIMTLDSQGNQIGYRVPISDSLAPMLNVMTGASED